MKKTYSKMVSRATLCVLTAGTIIALVHLWHTTNKCPLSDFYVLWAPAQYVEATPGIDVYTPECSRKIFHFVRNMPETQRGRLMDFGKYLRPFDHISTPFLYYCFARFLPENFTSAFFIYNLVCTVVFLLGYALLSQRIGGSLWGILALFIVIIYCFGPLRSDISNSNLGRLQFGLLCFFIFLSGSERRIFWLLAGALLGFLVSFKPTLLCVPIISFSAKLFWKQYRWLLYELAGFFTALFIAGVSSSIFWGTWKGWLYWVQHASVMSAQGYPSPHANFSLPVLIEKLTGASIYNMSSMLMVLLLFLIIAVLYQNRFRAPLFPDRFVAQARLVSLGIFPFFLSSSLVWFHYYTICLLPLILLLNPSNMLYTSRIEGCDRRMVYRGLVCCLFLLIAGLPLVYALHLKTLLQAGGLVYLGAFLTFILLITEGGFSRK